MPGLVKVLHAADGAAMFEALAAALRDEPAVGVDDDLSMVPDAHDNAVGVFVLTDQAAADVALADYLRRLVERGLPVVPVVPEIAAYDFSAMPAALDALRALNAVGWDQGSVPGEAVCRAIRRHLGLDPFVRYCKVFVSYRRADGGDVATQIHRHLREKGYQAFLDTEEIEGGEPVPYRIGEEVVERDFLLLVDSPQAKDSTWIMKEVETALAARVTVRAVRLPGCEGFPLLREAPWMLWDANDPDRLNKVERFVARAIGSKTTFDAQADRVVRQIARLENLAFVVRDPRRIILTGPGNKRHLLVEYEDAPVTLDRLYRLYRSYRDGRHPRASSACFIHAGPALSRVEREAMNWARGRAKLSVADLANVHQAVREFIT